MTLLTLEGTYEDGHIELSEPLGVAVSKARVLVTFLPPDPDTDAGPALDRETLRQRALARMKQGMHLGGSPYPNREERHDRADR